VRFPVIRILFGTMLLLAQLSGATMSAAFTPEPAAGYRVIACPFTFPAPEIEGESYECGVVPVPVDHADPAGPTLDLTVARLFATGDLVSTDPVLWLEGGPGASAIAVAESNRQLVNAVRVSRDVILFDQRGAGYSGYLECGAFQSAATLEFAAAGTPFPLAPDLNAGIMEIYAYAQATAALGFAECRAAYAERNLDLAHFTTEAIARDSVLLLDALGYSQATLWGTSYGGRVATVILREAPERVRAVVLDSPLPLGITRLSTFATLETEPAAHLFAQCANDAVCAVAYPDLEQRSMALIATLNANPIPIDPADGFRAGLADTFDGSGVIRLLTTSLTGNPDVASAIPRAIADLEAGDPVVALAVLSGSFPPARARDIPPTLTETSFDHLLQPTDARLALSLAMRTAVLCNDEADVTLADIAQEEMEGARSPLRGVVPLRSAVTLYAQCQAMNPGAIPLDRTEPTAAVPVLILAGAYDGTTAPSWAEEAAARLPNAHYLLIDGAGHATARWSGCAREQIAAFIERPDALTQRTCSDTDEAPWMLPGDLMTPEDGP
jgi:pimeloyl-ACP methyl ester carboxylesterase